MLITGKCGTSEDQRDKVIDAILKLPRIQEVLARGEIMRRFLLSGVVALKAASDAEKKKAQWEHQATMCVAGPEGDKGGGPW